MDCAAIAGLKLKGDHGGLLRSSAAFLDGHVEYIESVPNEFDTPRYTLMVGRVFAPVGAR
jgi:prepilin-type processing-associated H-X9-DG protein